jgi:heterodisulfide reductase subunit A
MKKGYIEAEGIVADIELTECNQCGLCSKRCPNSTITLDEEKNPEVAKLCAMAMLRRLPQRAQRVHWYHYSDDQVFGQVEAALEQDAPQKIIAFDCHWCALGGVDMAVCSILPMYG